MSAGQPAAVILDRDALTTPPADSVDPALRRFLAGTAMLITGAYTFLDYWSYSRNFHDGTGGEWQNLLDGRGFAPAQYRIGVLRVADLLARGTHTHLRHMFAALDFFSLGVSLLLLLGLLFRSQIFRAADQAGQWLLGTTALAVFLVYLLWGLWYQKPETAPTLLLLALSAAAAQWRRPWLAGLALVFLAAAGATVRVDALIAFHAGFLLVALLPAGRSLPLGRAGQVAVSLLSLAAAAGVAYAIMHLLYPNAPRQVGAFQMIDNLRDPLGYAVLVLALFPWWITLRMALRRWREMDSWALALIFGSIAHFALFYTLGVAQEVRIFLPYATVIAPLTAVLAYRAMLGGNRVSKD